jgi:hypothetical protein
VHGEVDAAVEDGAVDLLREQALVADHGEGHVGDDVAGGVQHLDVDLEAVVQRAEQRLHVVRLPERERAAAGGESELHARVT